MSIVSSKNVLALKEVIFSNLNYETCFAVVLREFWLYSKAE